VFLRFEELSDSLALTEPSQNNLEEISKLFLQESKRNSSSISTGPIIGLANKIKRT
jgi:fumarylacetoacetate (FAA) hydrolase family protein